MEDKSILTQVRQRLSASKRKTISLRMAPMIDLVFILLLFFLVATKWRPAEDSLPFKLPAAAASDSQIAKPGPLEIYISDAKDGCKVQIGKLYNLELRNKNLESDLAGLLQKIADCLNAQKRFVSDPIEIVCGPKVKWEHVAKIYNVFYGAGLSDITFMMTEQTDK